jgi:CheY-like chemotaxis protein
MTNRVLVVEDSPERMLVMQEFLRDRYRASFCESIADAIVALDRIRPQLILLDVSRRAGAAINFIRTFQEFPAYRTIPVLGMMENPGEEDVRDFLKAGFQAVVSRPNPDPFPLFGAMDRSLGTKVVPT